MMNYFREAQENALPPEELAAQMAREKQQCEARKEKEQTEAQQQEEELKRVGKLLREAAREMIKHNPETVVQPRLLHAFVAGVERASVAKVMHDKRNQEGARHSHRALRIPGPTPNDH
jgi:phosphoglycolate phosphatase-like HAD superfamily hydrolase